MAWPGLRPGWMGWAALLLACAACSPASGDLGQLLTREIHDSFPDYEVVAEPGELLCVHRPFRRDVIVDAGRMASECRLGPEECERSTQALMESLR